MLLCVSVVIDTEAETLAVYCNGQQVWPNRHWFPAAPCRGLDPNVFVPEPRKGVATPKPPVVMQLCPDCPVQRLCEDYGRATRSVGWWGGVYLALADIQWTKLTFQQAEEIRRRYALGGVLQTELAADYGVSRELIADVIYGRAWTSNGPPRRARKLSAESVQEIRERYAAGGVSKSALAREFDVSHPTVSDIIDLRSYRR